MTTAPDSDTEFDMGSDRPPRSPYDEIADNTASAERILWKIHDEVGRISAQQMEAQRALTEHYLSSIARDTAKTEEHARFSMYILMAIACCAAVLVFR